MVFTIVAVVLVLCLVPVFFLGAVGPSVWYASSTMDVETKLLFAETARPLALPPDRAISPFDAGRALFLLQLRPGESSGVRNGFVEQAAVGPPSLKPLQPYPATAFNRPVRLSDGNYIDVGRAGWWPDGPDPRGILAYAAGGLSTDERHWLEQLDASPRWELWRRFLRAPSADLVGARFVFPFADSLSASSLPVERLPNLKAMAYAGIARAALYRSRGERARGDTVLREIITSGFQLVDNSSNILELLVGIVTVGIGHGALNDAFVLDGRPEGKEFQARTNVVKARQRLFDDALLPASADGLDPKALRRRITARVTAQGVARGVRLAYYDQLARAPCTNVRELLTGTSADAHEAMTRARSSLARFPSEQALLDLMDRTPTVAHGTGPSLGIGTVQRSAWRFMYVLSRASGWILRNPRIPGCVSMVRDVLWLNQALMGGR